MQAQKKEYASNRLEEPKRISGCHQSPAHSNIKQVSQIRETCFERKSESPPESLVMLHYLFEIFQFIDFFTYGANINLHLGIIEASGAECVAELLV